MDNQPVYYSPPASHENHIRKMVIWLAAFFSALTVTVVFIVVFADKLALQLPFSAEKRFVRPYEEMASYFNDEVLLPEEQEIKDYLNNLADDLAKKMDMPEDYQIDVHYIDNGTVNAFATLGGHVFIFRGLLENMQDENSLAMVLAHELAHIKHRDPLAALGRGFAIQLLYSFVSGDYSTGVDIAVDSSEIGLLYFSREQEQAADYVAIKSLNDLYGHAGGYDSIFQYILKEIDEQSISEDSEIYIEEWLSTHPKVEKRIAALTKFGESRNYSLAGEVTLLPEWIKPNMRKIRKYNKKKEKGE